MLALPLTQDRIGKLRSFGLSEYAARAYLALLDLGTSEARDVSSLSKVPQAKIYHVLEQLHEKGLVVILPEFPKKYVPVPFEDYVNRVFEEHTKAAQQIEDEREELAEMFRVMGDTDIGNRGFFTVIRGRRNVLAKIEEIIQQSTRDLVVLGTVGTASRAQHLAPELRKAKERGVRVRFLAPMDKDTLPNLANLAPHADVRARDLVEEEQSRKVAILVSDGARAFLIHFVPDDGNLFSGKDIGVFTDQEAMVAAIQAIVEPHWASASDLETKRAEIEEGREREFVRIYTSTDDVRAALMHAVSRGAQDVLGLVAHRVEGTSEIEPLVERVARMGGRLRALLNVSDAATADALVRLTESVPGCDVRHLAPRVVARQWVLDDREAFFSIVRKAGDDGGSPESDLVIHTNHRAVIASMRAHFDSLWRGAHTLRTRRQELDVFPHLQPGDLGLGLLFGQIEDAVIVCDAEGKILLWNPAATRMFGRQAKDALGTRIVDLVGGGSAAAFERALEAAHAAPAGTPEGRRVVQTQVQAGRALEVEWLVSPIVDATMAGRLLLAIGRDTTDRKRAEGEAAEKSRQLAEAELMARIGSWTWDLASDRVSWSPGLYRIFGADETSVAASYDGWLSRVHEADRARVDALVKRATAAGGDFELRHRIVRPDGEERVLLCRGKVALGEDGRARRVTGIAQDVTEEDATAVPVIDADAPAPAKAGQPRSPR